MSHGAHSYDINYPSELLFRNASLLVAAPSNAVPPLPVAQQSALLPQIAVLLLDDAKRPPIAGPFPDGAKHLLDARPSSAAPHPRGAPCLAARQPSAPKQHASEALPFAAPQFDAYCCYRCSSCAHYTPERANSHSQTRKRSTLLKKSLRIRSCDRLEVGRERKSDHF